jgi:hypothetical protein
MGRRGEINPLTGCTDGKLASILRSALRQIWSRTVKKEYIKSVRYKKNGKYHVRCECGCGAEMATSAKEKPINQDGSVSKRRPMKLFDVDHIDGITPMVDPIYGLGPYWASMMTGKLQILKKTCHAKKTYGGSSTDSQKEKK